MTFPEKLKEDLAGEYRKTLTGHAKKATEGWPDLWEDEERGLAILRQVRGLLRAFWKAVAAKDWDKQDWYINQVRALYARLATQRAYRDQLHKLSERLIDAGTKEQRQAVFASLSQLLATTDKELWEFRPPDDNPFFQALSKLQKRALHKSTAPKICGYKECPDPFFLPTKRKRKQCCPACAYAAKLKQNRDYKRNKEAE